MFIFLPNILYHVRMTEFKNNIVNSKIIIVGANGMVAITFAGKLCELLHLAGGLGLPNTPYFMVNAVIS